METKSRVLAINTIFMYIRTCVLMIVALFTSRVVLRELGVVDYGIYNVIGSFVALFNSMRTLFASSTQRYLSYEIGLGHVENMNKVFCMSNLINALIGAIFFVVIEIIGYFYLSGVINIPEERRFAVQIVFQFSVISAIIALLTAPYDAVLIAHEKMNVLSILTIFESLLQLLIIFILPNAPIDKLITYGGYVLITSIAVRIINSLYCNRHFTECRLHFIWDKRYFKKMTSFAGWNFLGNTAYALSQNGLNMVLNFFGGPIVNTARGIAYQINMVMYSIISNVSIVTNPQTIKSYVNHEYKSFYTLVFLSSKILFLFQFVMSFLASVFTAEILSLWLGQIPSYSVEFIQLIMLYAMVRSLHGPVNNVFMASGDIRDYQICESILLFIPIVLTIGALYLRLPYSFMFYFLIACEIVDLAAILFIAWKNIRFDLKAYFSNVGWPCFILFVFFIITVPLINKYVVGFLGRLLISVVYILISTSIFFFSAFSRHERKCVYGLFSKK